jgi:polar amino acid transport system ATP-binding protein
MTALLSLDGVRKRFGANEVLRSVTLELGEHQVMSLIGASGCGKSTLLRCVNALEPVDAGVICLGGERVSGPGVDLNRLRREVGIVFQSYNLFPHMTVLDNVTLAPRRVLGQPRAEAEATAERLLRRIGLWDKAREYPDRLSGGQQQRAAIARALAMGPRLLLLDEITSALDPELVGEVLDIVRELAADGMTMILATHEMSFARDVSDVVCFLAEGQIRESGPPEAVLAHPQQQRTQAFLRRILQAQRL